MNDGPWDVNRRKPPSSQASVLDVVMFEATRLDNNTVLMAFSLNIAIVS